MYSEQTIKKLASDKLLMLIQDYLATCDINPMEKLNRSIALVDFWVAEGDKFKSLRKTVNKDTKLVWEHLNPYYAYWYKIKLICDGIELSAENLSKFDFGEALDFRNIVLGL